MQDRRLSSDVIRFHVGGSASLQVVPDEAAFHAALLHFAARGFASELRPLSEKEPDMFNGQKVCENNHSGSFQLDDLINHLTELRRYMH